MSEWKNMKHVTVPKQASVLNYHLISVTTRPVTFVYDVCALVSLNALHCTPVLATVSSVQKHSSEVPDNRQYRTTHCHCQCAMTGVE